MKKLTTNIVFTIFVLMISTNVFATGVIPDVTREDVLGLGGIVSGLLGLVYGIGLAFVTGMLLYIGIKYTMAAANEKAELKNSSIRYLIGTIILLALPAVFGLIERVMESLNSAF